MAEQFLEDIYRKSLIIEQVREYMILVNSGKDRDARAMYNKAAAGVERILPELSMNNKELADEIVDAAVLIRDSFDDPCKATAIAESRLLPLLFTYMLNYTGIDVEEGKYRIGSASSGFLTIRDNEQDLTMHNEYDPMWEAYRIADSLFDPEAETYHILGCGLGYLPYQLWMRSEGAAKIVVYEEDLDVLNYAWQYGVLSWIDKASLEIVSDQSIEFVAKSFIQEKLINRKEDRFYITPWKKQLYKGIASGEIDILEVNLELARSMSDRTAINIWKNSKHKHVSFRELSSSFKRDEWIVVSAGPSLDEQISFLKDSKDKIGIIAVNTVLRRLFKEGIRPDLVAAADQYVQMREHITGIGEQTEGIPLIAERRLNWQYLEQYRGPVCFVRVDNEAEDSDGELWQVSGSVAGLALEAVVRMGAKCVWLVGQDLAYPDGKSYAEGMPYNADAKERGTIYVPAVNGGMVATSEAFNWFRKGLEAQIARYDNVRFINLSRNGALIAGCESE